MKEIMCIFADGVKKFIKFCQEEDTASSRPYSSRYIGFTRAIFHRNLIQGGIFIYPTTTKSPKGKLRLLYECNPLAIYHRQATALRRNGHNRILSSSYLLCMSAVRFLSALRRWSGSA